MKKVSESVPLSAGDILVQGLEETKFLIDYMVNRAYNGTLLSEEESFILEALTRFNREMQQAATDLNAGDSTVSI